MCLSSRVSKFIFVGFVSTFITLVALTIQVEVFKIDPVLASVVGYIAGGILNYWLNYRFTFMSSEPHFSSAPKHFIVISLGLLLNTVVMKLGVEFLGIHYLITQFLAITIVVVISYLAGRYWTFSN